MNDLALYSKITSWLSANYGQLDFNVWCKCVVSELLELTNQNSPPIMLEPIAKLRNVSFSTLNNTSREKRFSFAHEIAHTFFYDISSSPPKELKIHLDTQLIEQVCSALAAEILMPSSFVDKFIKKYNYSSGNEFDYEKFNVFLNNFISIFNVSFHTASRRLIYDCNLHNILLLGISWLPKILNPVTTKLGELRIKESGFTLELYEREPAKLDANEESSCFWRIGWYAKPRVFHEKLFIPSNFPKTHLKIVENLFQQNSQISILKDQEDLKNFRLGNLEKNLKCIFTSRTKYTVYASLLSKVNTKTSQVNNTNNFNRLNSRILICVPLEST